MIKSYARKSGEPRMRKTRVYLASPYSVTGAVETADKMEKLHQRFEFVTRVLAKITDKYHATHVFFGPITMSHPVSGHLPIEKNTFEYWVEGIDLEWLEVMDEVWVLMDDGWDVSKGVNAEISYAYENKLDIKWVSPYTMDVVGWEVKTCGLGKS